VVNARLPILSGRTRRLRPLQTLALAAALAASGLVASARARPVPQDPSPARPALVIVLVVDQMRADYVERYGTQWTGGLRRLLDGGARFRQAAYPYLDTVTCAGHATIGTGTLPRTHGLIMNEWWDRANGRLVTCTEDPDAPIVSYGEPRQGGESPRRLRVPTLADVMRTELTPAPRVVTMSLKARAAIMLAGHRGDAVTWFDGTGWATSASYATAPVPAIARFVSANPVARELGRPWTKRLPATRYLFDDEGLGEKPSRGWQTTFPHPLADDPAHPDASAYERWRRSPFSDDYLGRLAEAAIDDFELGRGPGTDFLGVSFSALDLAGHWFGPRSHEVQDILAGVDATIGRLLDHLDRTVGQGRYVLALTADHGVAPIPAQIEADGLSAGRLDARTTAASIERALEPWFGGERTVATVRYTEVFLAPGVYARLQKMPEALAAAVAAIAGVPGVAHVFTRDTLADPAAASSGNPALRAAALGFDRDRSGDLVLAPQPYWLASSDATTHGTANLYDQRVPLVLFGASIRPGEYLQAATPADIAPTLASLTGVTLPVTDGRVLAEALGGPAAGRAADGAGRH